MRLAHTLPLLSLGFALGAQAQGPAESSALRSSTGPFAGFDGAAWAWTLGSEGTDWLTRVTRLRDGSLVAVGFVDRDRPNATAWDAIVIRLRDDGTRLWTRRLGGAGIDAFWDVREDAAGRILVAGFTASAGAGGLDGWLVAFDRDGRQLLERHYGGAGDDMFLGCTLAADGGLAFVGQTTSSGAGERDVWVVRTDAVGVEQWARAHGGPQVDRGFFIAPLDEGFVVAGVTGTDGNYDLLTLRLDADGGVRWRQAVGGPGNDPNHGLQVRADGRIIVAGYSQSWGSRVHDLVALTYSPSGELLRHEVMGGAGDDRAMVAVPDNDGGTLVVGYTTSAGDGGWDLMFARIDRDGAFEPWIRALGGAGDDQAYDALVLPGGDIVAAGYRAPPGASTGAPAAGAPRPDLLLLRIAPSSLTRQVPDVSRRTLPE